MDCFLSANLEARRHKINRNLAARSHVTTRHPGRGRYAPQRKYTNVLVLQRFSDEHEAENEELAPRPHFKPRNAA